MENLENVDDCLQIAEQEQETPQESILECPQNDDIKVNITPIDSGSANIQPGRVSNRKLFVGGLSTETTEDDLRTYFSKYGVIDSLQVILDPRTQRSKGFAFVVFSSSETITAVNAAGRHIINNKKVDTQLAKLKQGKIFVGGITAELSEEDIKSYFDQFGNVVEVQMPFDKVKNQRKNFCFVIFDSQDVVEKVLETPKVSIKNVEVDVKKAIQKPKSGQSGRDFTVSQGRMGFSQNVMQNFTPQFYGGQNWNGNQMFGIYGYDQQQAHCNAYGGYLTDYNVFQSYANGTSTTMRNNYSGFSRGTGRGGAGRRAGRRQKNTGRGNGADTNATNFRYQPY